MRKGRRLVPQKKMTLVRMSARLLVDVRLYVSFSFSLSFLFSFWKLEKIRPFLQP